MTLTYEQLMCSINSLFREVDKVQCTFPTGARTHDRLNLIRDQLVLLAMDLGMPIQPVKESNEED